MRSLQSLPSLNALRVFEAVARHLSFAKAAAELHVTPGAVSHQIAALEDTLGVALFVRGARVVSLTRDAMRALPLFTEGFDALRAGLRTLQDEAHAGALTLGVAPAFATRWLLPRLSRFAAAHPEVNLRMTTDLGLLDAVRDREADRVDPGDRTGLFDLEIRFGRAGHADRRADALFATSVTPVCSPRLLDGPHPLRHPDDLRHHALLHDDTIHFDGAGPDWAVWLDAARARGVDASRGPRFSHAGLALDAATDGLGVALGVPLLTADDLAAGRLVAPFAIEVPSPSAYYLVRPSAAADRPEATAFRDWLLAEAVAAPTSMAATTP